MNMQIKRFLALLVAAAFGGFAVSASAEEVRQTNAYVLKFSPTELPADYAYNKPFWHTTLFTVDHTITKDDGTVYYSGGSFPEVFNLINTTMLSQGGEGAYASIVAYSADAATGTRANTCYRRINLEESTYYDSGAAGKIRAVVMRGYPMNEVVEIQESANFWLRSRGLPEITELQTGEAILATQVAIWELANGENYTVNRFFGGMQELNADWLGDYLTTQVIDTSTAGQKESAYTAQNIESLYTYLVSLEAMAPTCDAVSESSFEGVAYTAVNETDGTYTVTVGFTVNTKIGDGDNLILSASCGDGVQSMALTQAGDYSFTFIGLGEREAVTLEINGYQHGGDVYLFDAEGGRGASQSMVGYDNSCLPVHGEITVTEASVPLGLIADAAAAAIRLISCWF